MAETLATIDARLAALAAEQRLAELRSPPKPISKNPAIDAAEPDETTEVGKVQARINTLLDKRFKMQRSVSA